MTLSATTRTRLRQVGVGCVVALVLGLGLRYAQSVDWPAVGQAITTTPPAVLLAAGSLSLLAHFLYCSYDLLGRRYTGHALSTAQVLRITFISYAFNLNLGSLVGGLGLRYRLYGRQGLGYGVITRIITWSWVTNWLGYLVLAGLVFLLSPLPLPAQWALKGTGLSWLGGALLATALFYVSLCLISRRRRFWVRGRPLTLPRPGLVAWQLLLSCAHWLTISAIVFTLLQGAAPYNQVLSVLLVAAIAGVITHVPAGLGVLEAVFVTLLTPQVPTPQLVGALLVYRGLFYLGPWLVAAPWYLASELPLKLPVLRAGPSHPAPPPPR